MKVLKFGGTSVGTVESLRNVKKIVEAATEPLVVVVSALGGLTDRLLAAAEMARTDNPDYKKEMEVATRRHHEIIEALVNDEYKESVKQKVDELLGELHRIYDGVAMLGQLPERTIDRIVSFGERMSSLTIAHIIDNAKYYHSPDFIKTEKWFNKNIADSKLTEQLIQDTFSKEDYTVAVTGGFISTDRDTGDITNLGRGGSDYTAALIAAAINADVLEIWTDVDGFMTADPRIISDAKVIDHLSFIESMELCTMGAKVIYPPTIYPVFHKNIPIRILNTHRPDAPGTWITDGERPGDLPIKGISSLRNTTLVRVEGELTDTASEEINSRTYNAMAKNGVSLYLVNSRTSGGFTFAVSAAETGNAIKILTDEFGPELDKGDLENISATYKLATIAIVGDKMKQRKDLLNSLTEVLGKEGIKVYATSDGTSDTTLAIVVKANSCDKALSLLHHAIYQPSC